MIEKSYGKFELTCDRCSRYVSGFDSFQDALDYAEEQEWTRLNIYGEWENFCEDCSENERNDNGY